MTGGTNVKTNVAKLTKAKDHRATPSDANVDSNKSTHIVRVMYPASVTIFNLRPTDEKQVINPYIITMSRKTVRVASYNIRKARGLDQIRAPERIIEVINGLGADVIALQVDLSRLRSGLSVHLGGLSFECQGAFVPQC